MNEEIKRTSGLQAKLEENGVNASLDELINFKQTVDNLFTKDTLTEEQRAVIATKMEKLISAYDKIAAISQRKISNQEKAARIEKELGTVPDDFIRQATKEIENVDEKMNSKIKGIKSKVKELFANATKSIGGFIDSHIAQKKEEAEQINKQETALIKNPEKKGALKRLFSILKENPADWKEVEQEDGTIKLINEEGEIRGIIETKDAPHWAAVEQSVLDAKRAFGFVNKIKTFVAQEKAGSTIPTQEEKAKNAEKKAKAEKSIGKINKNKKEIEETLANAEKGALEHAEQRGKQVKEGGRSIETIKGLLQSFKDAYMNTKDNAQIIGNTLRIWDAKDDSKKNAKKLDKLNEQKAKLEKQIKKAQNSKIKADTSLKEHTEAKAEAKQRIASRKEARRGADGMEH